MIVGTWNTNDMLHLLRTVSLKCKIGKSMAQLMLSLDLLLYVIVWNLVDFCACTKVDAMPLFFQKL